MALISKKKFLESNDYEYKDIYIRQLDGEIRVRALSIKDQLAFEELATGNDDQSELMFQLILKCCIDEDGELMFNEEDVINLKEKSADIIVTLFKAILNINNIDQNEVDNLAKN
jgi:hypothetical protein